MSLTPKPPRNLSAQTLSAVLGNCGPLESLQRRMRDSNDRFEMIRGKLPGELARHVKPGPVDDEGWSLLTTNAAVAAKLRQLVPRLETALKEGGWQQTTIRIKLLGAA
ncbi:hypothetical protein BH09PSE5_BH09PSE5_20870 [soil metagenome]